MTDTNEYAQTPLASLLPCCCATVPEFFTVTFCDPATGESVSAKMPLLPWTCEPEDCPPAEVG